MPEIPWRLPRTSTFFLLSLQRQECPTKADLLGKIGVHVGHLIGASGQRAQLLTPIIVRLPPSAAAGFWVFAVAVVGLYFISGLVFGSAINPCAIGLFLCAGLRVAHCLSEWDVNDPASAKGFTVIFNKARNVKTGVKPESTYDQNVNFIFVEG